MAAAGECLGERLRQDFPELLMPEHGRRVIYMDSAATSLKPQAMVDALVAFYTKYNAHAPRGEHQLSARATDRWVEARNKVARFVNAASEQEIVFTRNATEALNLVAQSWGRANLQTGDEVVMSVAEHDSNLVPWQHVAAATGATIRYARLTHDTQEIDMAHFHELLSPRTKVVALVHISNVLGCVLPVQEVVQAARKVGARVMLDSCQALPHKPIDVQALGVDWIVASGHKMCGPTGAGFLWGRREVLAGMPPFLLGGEMATKVTLEGSEYADPPGRFEAGTAAMGEHIGLGAACDYLAGVGMERVAAHGAQLVAHLYNELKDMEGVTIYGPPPTVPNGRAAVCTFNVAGASAADVCHYLDRHGIAVRCGKHNAQPLHAALGIGDSLRASLYLYNTRREVDALARALRAGIRAGFHDKRPAGDAAPAGGHAYAEE